MRLLVCVALLALCGAALAGSPPPASQGWETCHNDRSTVELTNAVLSPLPTRGAPIDMILDGRILHTVTNGELAIHVLFGGVALHHETRPLKDATRLPINPGPFALRLNDSTLTLPALAPEGEYTVQLVAKDQIGAELMCVAIPFKLGKIEGAASPFAQRLMMMKDQGIRRVVAHIRHAERRLPQWQVEQLAKLREQEKNQPDFIVPPAAAPAPAHEHL